MKIAFFSAKNYEIEFFNKTEHQHKLIFINENLSLASVAKAAGCTAICCFVTDCLDAPVIAKLAAMQINLIALRSAGYDHIDLAAAKAHNITVVRVPKYSPQAVAEFTVTLILALNRNIIKAYKQGIKFNFSLDGLMGFNLQQKTIGIIGTGNIGTALVQILQGFNCKILAYDPMPNAICRNLGVEYTDLEYLLKTADIISLHCLLNDKTHHILDYPQFAQMKKGAMLINTGRGALVNTEALIGALETGQLGSAGLDVYENERGLFFIDHHNEKINDKNFLKLQSFPNVIITPHQAFFTEEAVENIAKTTIDNITAFEQGNAINTL